MRRHIFDTWFRTALIPTSVSACLTVIVGSILFAYPFPGSLEAMVLTFTWAIWGVPLTFICASIASVFLCESAAHSQLRVGLLISLLAPVILIGMTSVIPA